MKEDYGKHYTEKGFWDKLKKYAIVAGKKVVYSALLAFYALDNPKVPLKAKAIIYGALGYLILPIDLVPDLIPVLGYSDDLTALLFAIGQVGLYINKEVRTNALNKLEEWFGPTPTSDKDIIDVECTIVDVEKNIDEIAVTDEDDKDDEGK